VKRHAREAWEDFHRSDNARSKAYVEYDSIKTNDTELVVGLILALFAVLLILGMNAVTIPLGLVCGFFAYFLLEGPLRRQTAKSEARERLQFAEAAKERALVIANRKDEAAMEAWKPFQESIDALERQQPAF
jgi:hypothetical protein